MLSWVLSIVLNPPSLAVCACVSGDVYQIDVRWTPRYHWHHRECEFLFYSLGSLTLRQPQFMLSTSTLTMNPCLNISWVCFHCPFPLQLLPPQSPADQCKKIHAGDEVIQVNHQTVVSKKASKHNAIVIKNYRKCTFHVFPL